MGKPFLLKQYHSLLDPPSPHWHCQECSRACCCTDCCLIWVKRYSEVKSADFYLSDPNFPATTHPNGPQLFVPARGPPAGAGVGSGVGKEGVGADGVIEALDFHALRSDRPRKGNLNIYFSGTVRVLPPLLLLNCDFFMFTFCPFSCGVVWCGRSW